MRSKFAIADHPIHPFLVVVPIGLFLWTFVSDILYRWVGDKVWYDIALWTGIAAIVSALVAALPGLGDYFTMRMQTRTRTIATTHMVLNLSIIALYSIAAVLMSDDGAVVPGDHNIVLVLHGIGSGLLIVSGWLGGEMVYKHGLAVTRTDVSVVRPSDEDVGRPRRAA